MAFTKEGSQLLEQAIEHTGRPALLGGLRGRVLEAALSPYGNHTLQKYIAVMFPRDVQFIVDELRGSAALAARHFAGCRVLQSLMQHCAWEQVCPLVAELLEELHELVSHRYGNFVVQQILEHGHVTARARIVDALCANDDLQRLARHWVACNVVRCALERADPADRRRLALLLAPNAQELARLTLNRYGSFIARTIKTTCK